MKEYKPEKTIFLKKAYLEITDCCNLSCSFCHGTSRNPRFLSLSEYETLIRRLQGHIEYLYFHLMGEPLLHPDLPYFINDSARRGLRPMVTTNGTLLPDRKQELLKSSLYKISISLHSAEANGVFADKNYLSDCTSFACDAASKGIITVFRLWNIGGKDRSNSAILNTLREVFPDEWRQNRSGFCLSDHIFLEWGKKFDWPDIHVPEISDHFFCYGLRDQIGILSDGTVVPCCLDSDGIISLGNLLNQELDDILTSPRATAIYNGFTDHTAVEELCRRCGYAAETQKYHSL